MCPRAAGQRHGAVMARTAGTSVPFFGEEEYIDLDLSSCGEFELRRPKKRSAAAAACADELLCNGDRRAPLQCRAVRKPNGKEQELDGGGRRSAATVAPLQPAGFLHAPARQCAGGSRCKKAVRTVHSTLQASRAFLRSLFVRPPPCSDEHFHATVGIGPVRARSKAPSGPIKTGGNNRAPFGQIKNGSSNNRGAATTLRTSIEREKLMDEEERARHRKSFSGVIKWRLMAAAAASGKPSWAPPGTSSGGGPALKRSSSAGSEAEGLIQGAIAYCKKSQQQQQLVLARKSVSDAGLCPF